MSLVSDRTEELISALLDLQEVEFGRNDYRVSREVYKLLEKVQSLYEKYSNAEDA